MRRWLTAVALGGMAVLGLAGCGNPAGVDGDLTDDWAMVSEPKVFTPQVGACLPRAEEVGYLSGYNPVDCGEAHQVEIAHVGNLSGEHAERTTPPPAGSPAMRQAFAECSREATKLLGAEWRSGRMQLTVVFPAKAGWSGGARWFRCDLAEIASLDEPSLVMRTKGLKDALRAGSDLAHGCFRPKLVKDDIDQMQPTPCTSKHRAEFAGVYTAPDVTFSAFQNNSESIHKGCRGVIATFAKVPNNGDLRYRVGSIYYYPNEDEWKNGNRGVQCFLWVSDRDLTRSMKGAGPKALPIR